MDQAAGLLDSCNPPWPLVVLSPERSMGWQHPCGMRSAEGKT